MSSDEEDAPTVLVATRVDEYDGPIRQRKNKKRGQSKKTRRRSSSRKRSFEKQIADTTDRMPDHDPTSADAEWKKIQQRTFTRWCNEHLKVANIVIYDLETDLCDGIKLIVLLEVLAHKRVGKYNKKPNFKSQKLENVAIALKFIENENIKLVNIDAGDIVRGNLKLILGLIWTLILKYQIAMPMGDYEFDDDDGKSGKKKDKGMTPKQALLAWVKSKMPPEIPMNNFTTDWNDGRAIAALVDAVEPGLFPDVDPEDLDPNDAVNNAKKAMDTAEKYLGVPPVLDAADMCNPKVDEMSIMTYVSYFPEAKCKPGAPHRPQLPAAAKCSAEGPGITPLGLVAKQSAPFTVFTAGAGKGTPQVNVFGPERSNVPCEVVDNGDKTFACKYSPPEQGIYDIHIKWKGRHIPKSPFRVKVASDLDSSKCYAEGPGLQSGIVEQQWTNFTVYTEGAGEGKLHVDVIDPHLSKVDIKIEEKGAGEFYVLYKPILHGKHTINIKFGGEPINKSPFHVNVVSSKKEPIPTKVKAYGPGLEPKGIVATTEAVFTIDGKDAGDGDVKVVIKGPKGEVPCDIKDNGDGTYTCTYRAQVAGRHTITITWSGKGIPKSPYRIEVSPYVDITKIRAYGPGLEKGVAGQPCKFTVETSGAAVDTLGFAVEGPHQAEIKCRDLGNGKCEVIYYPTKPGDYTVHVTCNGKDIPDSPFTVPITPGGDASKCYAEGPGLEPEGVVANVPATFTVFTKDAGVGEVEVTVKDDKAGRSIPVEIMDNKDGTTSVVYYPDKPGKYTITVTFNGKPIPKSPFKVNISLNNPAKCKAYGPGLEKSTVGQPAKFTIETKDAGDGGLGLTIEGPTETKIDCKDNGDGTCDVTYFPEEPGDHLINILFADKHIPGSPFKAKASYPVDASKVVIGGPGLEPGVKAGLPADIDIDATKAGDAPLEVEVLNPQNKKVKVEVDEEEPGIFAATYYPDKPGKYTVNVKYGGKHVPKSPVKIDVKPKGDASKCKLKGPGLESPVVNEPTNFDVHCKRAGDGDLAPTITSPSGEKVEPEVKDNGDGTYTVGYTPTEDGPHKVDVKYDGDSIPGTPKEVNVLPKTDTGKVKAYGPGLESALTGQKAQFTVDTREAGPGGLSLAVEGPSEAKLVCKDNKDGTCSATYVPEEPGEYDVHVKFADEHVPGSPFKVKASRPVDASKVKCFGPGVDKAPLFERAPTHFTVDTAEAGDAPLDVTIETPDRKKIQPDEIKKVDDNTYEVQYTPPKEGRYAVDVKYGDKPVPNSPFRVRAGPPYDASKVKVSGPGVAKTGIVAEEVTKAVVDTTEAGIADLSAFLETPSGEKVEPTITPLPDEPGKYEIAYVPEETGPHKLNVKYGKDHVKDSPFRMKVAPGGDASKVKVSGEGIEKPRVGQLVDILFDTTEAGQGKPRCSIKSPSGKDVPVNMIDNGDGTYTCQWTPTEEGVHKVDVTYGGEPVRGSPFKVKAVKPPVMEKIKSNVVDEVEALNPCVDQPLEFGVDPREAEPEGGKGKLTSSIVTPSGKTEYPDVRANPDDTYAVTYTPKEPGIYSLSIMYDEEPIPGSPFQFEVVEGGPERVIAFGKGLERGIVEEPCEFTVITKDAGPGGLSLAVEGPSKSEIQCVDNGDGSCSVSYVPKEPGEYNVVVKFADKHIPGSPFAAEIFPKGTDLGDVKRERPVVGKPCDVKLDIPDVDVEKDFDDLTGTLRRPGSDKEEPVELSKNPDGTVGVTFTPYEPGEHLISIKKRGRHVQNSPFSVMVQAPRLGDLFSSGHPAEVDLSNIKGLEPEDFDKLTATLRRPKSKVDESVRLIKYPDDSIGVSFVPREPGEHFLTVKKDGRPIPGSPFSILVESEEPINAVSAPVDAVLDLPGVNLPEDFKKLKGSLKRPSSNDEEPLQLVLNSDNSLSVSFIPKETGKHLVNVKKFNRHVTGSPFPVMVTSPEPVNRAGVPCGVGLEDIPVEDLPKLEAGLQRPGSNVEEPIRIKQNSDNTLSASFVPHEEGPHKLHVRKDKKPLPESPYIVDVLGKDKVEEVHPVGRTCDVGLDIPGVVLPEDFDKLEATIQRPNSDKEEPLNLELYPDNTLGISFVPLEPGEHLIRVKKSGEDVPGSPFAIMVEAAEAPNAVGRPCDCQLDIPELNLPEDLPKLKSTLKRPGSNVEEPIKLKILSDNTLSASFVPKSPGEHLITVKKNNRHVTGSPFSVMVTAAEPANRVGQPVGVGLEDIPVEDLPRLEAGLQRPGSEVEEPVRIKQNSDDTLSAQFIPHEEGVHKLHVRKDKKPLPESPYLVNVIGKDVVEEVHPVGRTCDVGLDIPGVALPDDFKKLTATLQRPRSNKEEPVNLELNPDNTLGVTFVPKEPGTHWIRVRKSGKEVPESPFPVKIEPEKPEYAVGSPCDVPIDAENLKPEDLPKLTATLKRPGSKEEEPVKAKITSDGNLSVSFIPKSPGEHLITVKKRSRQIPGSPFSVMVTAPEPINEIGKPSSAPLENVPVKDLPKLEAGLLRPGSTVEEPVTIKQTSDDNLYAPFIPHEEGPHKVNVRKDGKPVPDSPYTVDVLPKEEKQPVEEVYPVGRPCDVGLDVPSVKLPDDFKKLTGTLQRPNSKTEEPVNLELNPDNTVGVSFVPKEPGEHLIRVKKSGKEVPESPFSVLVEPAQPEYAVGAPCDVPIDVKDIKPEDLPKLTGTLKRPGSNVEEPVEPKILSDGNLSVSFVPKTPGEHLITVKKRGRPIPGSPFPVMVTAPEPTNEIGKPSSVPLENIPVKDLPKLDAGLLRPGSTVEEPVTIKKTSDDNLYAPFIPHEEGPHKINVRKDGKPVPDSPYSVDVPPKVEEQPVEEVYPMNRPCDVGMDIPSVNLPDDFKKLTATLQRPGSTKEEPVNLELNPDNTLGVTFVPKTPGEHLIRIKKDGKEIPESPVSVMIESAEPENAVNSPCDVPLDIPGLNLPEDLPKLTATLKRPGSNKEEPVEPKVTSDGNLSVSFVPKSPGEHFISVKKRGRHVPGSPFSVMITAPEPTNEIGKPSNVPLENIPAKDLPKLDAGLIRPNSKVEEPVPIKKTSDDSLYVPFVPHEEGPHKINVRKDGKPVPDSPYVVDVPPKAEEQPVEEVYPMNRPCDVGMDIPSVNLPDDFKKLTATLQRPGSTKEEPVNLELNPDNTLGVTFVPKGPGEHLIRIKKNGKEIPESPISVMIEPAEPENAVNSPCDVPLDIPGLNLPEDLPKLTATLKRPGSNKEEPVEPKVTSDGNLSVSFVPKSPGEHFISVKKRGRHVPGSPFSVMITAPEPKSEIGKPANVPLENIPAKDLPKLDAGLIRPNSKVEEPVPIKKTSDDNLYVPFIPHEEGPHKINVRKDGKPVPYSPYVVDVPPKAEEQPVEEVYPMNRPCDVGMDIPSVNLPDDFKKLTATLQRPGSTKEEPVDLELNPDNTLGVTFVPKGPGEHLIRIKKDGKEIPESPVSVMVESAEPENAVNSPCDVPLDIPGLNLPEDLPKLTATLKRPGSNKEEPVEPKVTSDGNLSVSFVPKSPGEHLISVKKHGRHVPGSPFSVMITAPEPKSEIGKPANVPLEKIPAKDLPKLDAGLIRPKSTVEEPVPIKKTSDDNLYVPFIPHEGGPHKINVRKDGKPVPDSPYIVDVPSKDVVDDAQPVEEVHPVGKACDVGLDIPGVKLPDDFKKLTATLQRPKSTKEEPVNLELNPDNTLGVSFVPMEPGDHLIRVKQLGKTLLDSPLSVMVEDVEPESVVGNPCEFRLDVPSLNLPDDLSRLTVTIKRPGSTSEEPVKPRLLSDNSLSVSFVPKSPGEYLIAVKKRNRPVPGSPFSLIVTSDEPTSEIGKPSSVPLENIPAKDLPKLDAGLLRPGSTVEEPVPIKKTSDDNLYAPFIPHEGGPHKINVRKDGKPVPGGSFLHDVSPKDVEDGHRPDKSLQPEKVPSQEKGPLYEKRPLPDEDILPEEGLPPVQEVHPSGKPCDVDLDIPGVKIPEDVKKLTATLQRPGNNKKEPVIMEIRPDNTLGVSFLPTEPGEYIIRVQKSGVDIPGSTVTVLVETVDVVNSTNGPCEIVIKNSGLNFPDDLPKLKATLKRPGSRWEEPVTLKLLSDNTLSLSFLPKTPGEYQLSIMKRYRPVPGSPFSITVTDEKPENPVGKPVSFALDDIPLRDLPRIQVFLQRPGSDTEEPITLKQNSDNSFSVSFVPREPGVHKIHVRKNCQPLPGSPYEIEVIDDRVFDTPAKVPYGKAPYGKVPSPDILKQEAVFTKEVSPAEEKLPVGRICEFNLEIPGFSLPRDFRKLTATIRRPSGKREEPINLELNPDNTLGISFVPMEPGEHLVRVKKSGEDVPGSPFAVMVEAAEAVNAVGRPCDCHLDIPGLNLPADLSKIKSTLKRPDSDTEEPIKLKVLSDNTLSASFVPRSPGEHLISVKKFNRHLSGSPFSVMVSAPEAASQSVGRPCGLGLEIPGLKLPEDFDLLTGLLKRPGSTTEEPLKLVLNSDNTLSVSFIPKETGEHLISVFKNKRHVTGSPFSVMVSGPGPADASKVKAYGPGLDSGVVNEKSEFTVNTRDAGYGGLGLSIEGPSKAEINCVDNEDGTCTVDFVPTEPGDYTIHVRFADEEIPGSPFTCNVVPKGGKRRPIVEEGISRDSVRNVEAAPAQRTSQLLDDLVSFSPQQPHDFALDLKGYDVKNLKATVETPSGKTEPAEIVESTKDTYTVRFVTKEGGIYKVFVKNRGRDIPGSPFKVKVDAPKWGGAGKCSAAGPGLERGVVNQPAIFTVWTRDAGPGGLAVAIEGPAKTEIDCKDNGDGSCSITYVPTEPGEYTVHVRFADEDIPGAPFKVFVTAEEDERFRDLSVSDMLEGGLGVGQPASFSVQTNGPVGEVTASVLSPSGSESPATVSDRGNGSYAIRFVPKEVGDHLISVKFDEIHIPGSPFKVKVGGGESYPGRVKAYGPGLEGGVAGQETYFTVDALRAGTGALSLSVDGPAKVRMNCTENPDGTYKVTYHPLIAGEYKITIKFADQNIPKSPYNVTITGDGASGYAEKCKPVGSGLHRAVIGEPNAFTVNCSDAGRGSLMVGVEGPAIPAKEIKIKHTGGKVYAVNYTLEEPGEYVLKVLWGEKHIPGSPFHVTV